ncbi:MAG: hypothetical protein AAFY02_20165 [Pseudomonadota bacterium]
MNEFPPDWLALREARDRKARDSRLLDSLYTHFADRPRMTVCDLGAGTAALLRALSPGLPRDQEWILIDQEAENLMAAKTALEDWAKDWAAESRWQGETLELRQADRAITVRWRQADLSQDLVESLAGADLVAASALFDLAGPAWIGRLAGLLAARRLPLYASLTFSGLFSAEPPLPLDQAIEAAFSAHQRSDKGLGGVAAGPSAEDLLALALQAAGAEVTRADSSWHIDQSTPQLLTEVIQGFAAAASETGLLTERDCTAWREARLAETARVTVGHGDLLATWVEG